MSKFSICEINKDKEYAKHYECSTHGIEYMDNDKNQSAFCPVGEVESDLEEVKELLAEQEKKTKILLDALEEVSMSDCSCVKKSSDYVYPKDNVLYTQESPCCTRLPEEEDSFFKLVLSPLGWHNNTEECWQQYYWFTVSSYYKERSDIKWAHCRDIQIGPAIKNCITCRFKQALEEYKKE